MELPSERAKRWEVYLDRTRLVACAFSCRLPACLEAAAGASRIAGGVQGGARAIAGPAPLGQADPPPPPPHTRTHARCPPFSDPVADEELREWVRPWSEEEKKVFADKFLQYSKARRPPQPFCTEGTQGPPSCSRAAWQTQPLTCAHRAPVASPAAGLPQDRLIPAGPQRAGGGAALLRHAGACCGTHRCAALPPGASRVMPAGAARAGA